jgi:FkbM family methyltransferase
MNTLFNFLKLLTKPFPKINSFYRILRDAKFIFREPKTSALGFKFYGNRLMETGVFEHEETALVKKIMPNIEIVLNIGANIGYYVCLALHQKKEVIAFEPSYDNVRYLLENVYANEWQDNCQIFPIALSNKIGIVEIFGGGTGASLLRGWAGIDEDYKSLVPCTTLNTVLGNTLFGRKLLVIVDIEGAENPMLQGASNILEMSPKPIWLIEISVAEHQPAGIAINPDLLATFNTFWDRGYECVTADVNLNVVSKDEIVRVVDTALNTFGTHSFLFYETGNCPLTKTVTQSLVSRPDT